MHQSPRSGRASTWHHRGHLRHRSRTGPLRRMLVDWKCPDPVRANPLGAVQDEADRHWLGERPTARLNARLNAASDS
jgi:hypothetical protein